MNIKQIIKDSGGPTAFSKEMHIASRQLAQAWGDKNEVPSQYWARLIRLCRRKRIKGVSFKTLGESVALPD